MSKQTSKAALAKQLVAMGCTKSPNTLRGYSRERLEAMLVELSPITVTDLALPKVEAAVDVVDTSSAAAVLASMPEPTCEPTVVIQTPLYPFHSDAEFYRATFATPKAVETMPAYEAEATEPVPSSGSYVLAWAAVAVVATIAVLGMVAVATAGM